MVKVLTALEADGQVPACVGNDSVRKSGVLVCEEYSPPRRGGEAARSIRSREATFSAQTGWSVRRNI